MTIEAQGQPGAALPIAPSTPVVESQLQTNQPQVVSTPDANHTVEPDDSKLDANTKAYIQSLRKESAKYRTEAKTHKEKLESVKASLGLQQGSQETPEQLAQRLHAEREQVGFENAVLTNAIRHGVSEEGMEYFQFRLAKEAARLGEGEELASEKIAEIARDARAKSVKPNATTTVVSPQLNGAGTGNAPNPSGNTETLSVERFAEMGFNDRCRVFETNPELYERLYKQATQKRLLK